MTEFLSSLALAAFLAVCMYAMLFAMLSVFCRYSEPFCRFYLALYDENQYKHYMAALDQKEIPVYSLRDICKYGVHEPKDMYYIIVFDDGDAPLYYNEKIVISPIYRPAVNFLREKRGKEVTNE